jgi:hypothetical protein
LIVLEEGQSVAESQLLLRRFVSLQAELLRTLMQLHPEVMDPWAAKRLPRHGELSARGERWRFSRQSTGVSFEGQDSRRVVDAHRAVRLPETFDAWRLMLYFESINMPTVQLGAQEYATDDEQAVEQWLLELEKLGLVRQDRTLAKLWKLAPEH